MWEGTPKAVERERMEKRKRGKRAHIKRKNTKDLGNYRYSLDAVVVVEHRTKLYLDKIICAVTICREILLIIHLVFTFCVLFEKFVLSM